MNVLVINCGSSSLKYQLIDSETEQALAVGLCERIGIDGKLTQKVNGEKTVIEEAMPNHEVAIKLVLEALTDANHGVIDSMYRILFSIYSYILYFSKYRSYDNKRRSWYITYIICWIYHLYYSYPEHID